MAYTLYTNATIPTRIEIKQYRVFVRLALYAHTDHISDSFFSLARVFIPRSFFFLLLCLATSFELELDGYTENEYKHVVADLSRRIQQKKKKKYGRVVSFG